MMDTVISHLFLLCVPVFFDCARQDARVVDKKKFKKKTFSAVISQIITCTGHNGAAEKIRAAGSVFKTAREGLAKTDLN